MFAFANKSHLIFEPGYCASFATDSTGVKYNTPAGVEVTLNDLSRLQYLIGKLRYSIRLSATDNAGVLVVKLKKNGSMVSQQTINCDGSQEYHGSFVVAIGDAVATDLFTVEFEVTTATAASVTGELASVLEVESPLIVGAD